MNRRAPLVSGETYHVYNRGAHKAIIFNNPGDYRRFKILMHLANNSKPIEVRNILHKYGGPSSEGSRVFDHPVDKALVDILAYCLMPNHIHLVVRAKNDEGTTAFMRKLFTGYSMYFNTKYDHSGTLFQGRFKSSHIDNEAYFRYIFAYVHLNPLGLLNPQWEEEGIASVSQVRSFMNDYAHSSFYDYNIGVRSEGKILNMEDTPEFLKEQNDVEDLFRYYTEDRPL